MRSDKLYYFDDNYFYKSYNVLSESNQVQLVEESDSYLKTHRKVEEEMPIMMAENFFTKKLLEKPCWKNLTKKILTHVSEYSKNYLQLIPKLESCWINKVGFYPSDVQQKLYFDSDLQYYSDNHYHSHHENQIMSCVFYLRNPNKKYGTLIRTKNGSLVLDGTENSLLIFDPRLYHTGLWPSPEESSKYPRYLIIMSFIKGSN